MRLILNGNDKGIYALQEAAGPTIDSDGDGAAEVVLSYDVQPLLEAVSYFGDLDSAAADPVSNVASSRSRLLADRRGL